MVSLCRLPFHEFMQQFFARAHSTCLCEIEEYDDRGIANGSVMAGEVEATCFAIHTEDGDVVSSLIATIEELAGGVKVEASR